MNSNTAGPVDRAAPRVTPRRPTRGVVINMDEGVGATRDATGGAAGAQRVHSVEAGGLCIDCVGS